MKNRLLMALFPLLTLAQFALAQQTGDFRSRQNGNWNQPATWERFDGTDWLLATAGQFPNDATRDVTVRNHTVIVTTTSPAPPYFMRHLTVEVGGKLFANANIQNPRFLTVFGNVIVDGIIGNYPISDDISLNMEGANVTISGSSSPTSFAVSRLRKTLNQNYSPPIGQAVTNLTIQRSLYTTYNHATFGNTQLYNNSASTFNVTVAPDATVHALGSVSIDGTSGTDGTNIRGTFTIHGTLNIGGTLHMKTNNTGTQPNSIVIAPTGIINVNAIDAGASISGGSTTAGHVFSMQSNASGGALLNITGPDAFTAFSNTGNTYTMQPGTEIRYSANANQIIRSELSYRNLTLTGSGVKTLSGSLLTVNETFTTSNAAIFAPANGTIVSLLSHWYNTGSALLAPTQHMFLLNGSSPQLVSSDLPLAFHTLVIANDVLMATAASVSNQLTFSNGKLHMGLHELKVSNPEASAISGYGPNAYVVGKLRRHVEPGFSYDFPVGTFNHLQLLNFTLNSATGLESVVASFSPNLPSQMPDPNVTRINGTPITDILNSGFWTLSPDGYTDINYDITLYQRGWTNFTGTPAQLGVIRRDDAASPWLGTGPNSGFDGLQGYHENSTQSIANDVAVAKRSGLQVLSDFAIGFGNAVLPVTLASFEATPLHQAVVLHWRTESEINNDRFVIERSADGHAFITIGDVKGQGNSVTAYNYEFVDRLPMAGFNYYRLKQVDFDGTMTYSAIRVVKMASLAVGSPVLYPNPASDVVYVTGMGSEHATVQIVDTQGAIYEVTLSEKGEQTRIDVQHLPAGLYYLRVLSAKRDESHTFSIIR